MKTFITSIILFISVSIFLSSCGSKFSLTKRHYRNGYYVSNTSKLSVPKIKDAKKIAVNKPAVVEPIIEENVYSQANNNDVILTSDVNKNYSSNKEIKKNAFNPSEINKSKEVTKTIALTIIKKNKFKVKKIFKSDGDKDRDGLSLFWIVILVILILWLLGFLAGGFGLGGLINLLLVVVLILLILWLLRVI